MKPEYDWDSRIPNIQKMRRMMKISSVEKIVVEIISKYPDVSLRETITIPIIDGRTYWSTTEVILAITTPVNHFKIIVKKRNIDFEQYLEKIIEETYQSLLISIVQYGLFTPENEEK